MILPAQRLLVATTNVGKLRDFEMSAAMVPQMTIEPLPGLRTIAAPDEDQESFEGNARTKAIYYSSFAPGEVVIADDSGLEVDALHGAPGVRSARYAEDCGFALELSLHLSQDDRNNLCLMAALRDEAASARVGRYRCALVAARDGAWLATGMGAVEGTILNVARGNGGFGYDPLFLAIGEELSMAELDTRRRMELSHRGSALRDLLKKLGGTI